MQSIVSGSPVNLAMITSRRRLIGFRPCSLLVAHGTHVVLPPTIESVANRHDLLLDQVSTISNGKTQYELVGKCFPVGPRHVCLTLHQVVPPLDYEDYKIIEITANVKHGLVIPACNPADADDKSKKGHRVIREVDAPKRRQAVQEVAVPGSARCES